MNNFLIPQIARELQLERRQVVATVALLEDGATVPFIARYRKENTATLDEVAISNIRDRLSQLRELGDRRKAILSSLEKQGLLTEELGQAVLSAESLAALEDTYLPFRPKRRTRAAIAREKGLAPLALYIRGQEDFDVGLAAAEYVNPDTEVKNVQDALSGARDIIAEWVSEEPQRGGQFGSCFGTREYFRRRWLRVRKRRQPSTGITSSGRNLLRVCLPTGHWPCSGERRKRCFRCI